MAKYRVIKFGAEWCGPCHTLDKTLSEIEPKYPQIEFEHVDVEEEFELATQYKIRGVPAMVFLKDGEVVNKLVGAMSASSIEDAIKKFIN